MVVVGHGVSGSFPSCVCFLVRASVTSFREGVYMVGAIFRP